jgi:hypothetical protein
MKRSQILNYYDTQQNIVMNKHKMHIHQLEVAATNNVFVTSENAGTRSSG